MEDPRRTPEHEEPRERGAAPEPDKRRIPARHVEEPPGKPPVGNGAVDEPAAFPPHN